MSDENKSNGGPAFPSKRRVYRAGYATDEFEHVNGMTLREYAAIKLKVPNSGDPELDAMIRQSLRNDFAAKAMQSDLVGGVNSDQFELVASRAYMMADAMQKASEA